MRNYNPLIRVNEKIDAAPANVWDVITHVEWSPASAARSYMLQAIPVRGYEPANVLRSDGPFGMDRTVNVE